MNKNIEKILEKIDSSSKIKVNEFVKWCIENELWETLSKNQEIFLKIIEDHNEFLSLKKEG
ncbi:MAG: hypothetical protein HFH86_01485 [Bacilli bacterium]|jgi:hypothetical protein|nr:hypothetical protein [Bacilli bacterium]